MNKAIKLVLKEGTTFDLYFFDCRVKRYNILSLADKFPQLYALAMASSSTSMSSPA